VSAAAADKGVFELTPSPPSGIEMARLVTEWNRTEVEFNHDAYVHQEIEARVSRAPERIALIFRNDALTYRELDQRAGQLAIYLRSIGVGPDMPVGICVERSIEMVVAMLGVLKAGGAYLPLDPAFPADRIEFMVADSGARAIIIQPSLRGHFAGSTAAVIEVDRDGESITHAPVPDGPSSARGASLAYLIYTSGSTGKPKGVMIEHRNVVNFFAGMDRVIKATGPGVWLAVTSISFDISVLELLWTLARGFTVVIQPENGKLETTGEDSIPAQMMRHGVTHLQCTPTHARLLMRSTEALPAMRSLHALLVGGEEFPLALARQIRGAIDARILNMYGPTETTIWSTCFELVGDEPTIPIGKPIANTQIYILDPNLEPVTIGEVGELYIGGAGVARGYWKLPELTAERFIANPFVTDKGALLYKTGDMARYRADGTVEFIGRADFQVKLNGFRIELGEIETVLGEHPGIREAVVMADLSPAGDPQLAAFIIAHPEQGLSAAEVRIYARQKLPKYMVPARFTFLEAMPVTPNGKVDRKALSAIRAGEQISGPVEPGARTHLEKAIVAVWQGLLGAERIGLHSNFFDLGATSHTVAEAASSLREMLKREIKLTDLFGYPTVAALAAYLSRAESAQTPNSEAGRGAARRAALAARASRTAVPTKVQN
jgi:amino acid adenylation domain-containing protein